MSKITKSANGESCIRCGAPDAYACHYNGYLSHSYGKGRGIKAHDIASAEFCYQCDQMFSESNYDKWKGGSKCVDRSEKFHHFIMLTNIRRFERGTLKV